MKKLFTLVLLMSGLNFAHAADFYNFNYTVRDGEDFPSILKKFVKPTAIITKSSPTIVKTTESNPRVGDWRNLEQGSVIALYINQEDFDLEQFESYVLANKESFNPVMRERRVQNDYKTSVYYMASYGSFTQEKEGIANIDYYQNSPITLGLESAYQIKDTQYAVSGNVFYSKMKASIENIENKKVDIPSEYGVNVYMNYAMEKPEITLFAGLDYENFYSFNMNELKVNRSVSLDETKAAYLTLGVKKYFKVYDRELTARASLSKTISTTSTSDSPIAEALDYDGMKINVNLDYQFTDRFYFKTQFKYHSIEGSSNLNSVKFGFGVGYVLF